MKSTDTRPAPPPRCAQEWPQVRRGVGPSGEPCPSPDCPAAAHSGATRDRRRGGPALEGLEPGSDLQRHQLTALFEKVFIFRNAACQQASNFDQHPAPKVDHPGMMPPADSACLACPQPGQNSTPIRPAIWLTVGTCSHDYAALLASSTLYLSTRAACSSRTPSMLRISASVSASKPTQISMSFCEM